MVRNEWYYLIEPVEQIICCAKTYNELKDMLEKYYNKCNLISTSVYCNCNGPETSTGFGTLCFKVCQWCKLEKK